MFQISCSENGPRIGTFFRETSARISRGSTPRLWGGAGTKAVSSLVTPSHALSGRVRRLKHCNHLRQRRGLRLVLLLWFTVLSDREVTCAVQPMRCCRSALLSCNQPSQQPSQQTQGQCCTPLELAHGAQQEPKKEQQNNTKTCSRARLFGDRGSNFQEPGTCTPAHLRTCFCLEARRQPGYERLSLGLMVVSTSSCHMSHVTRREKLADTPAACRGAHPALHTCIRHGPTPYGRCYSCRRDFAFPAPPAPAGRAAATTTPTSSSSAAASCCFRSLVRFRHIGATHRSWGCFDTRTVLHNQPNPRASRSRQSSSRTLANPFLLRRAPADDPSQSMDLALHLIVKHSYTPSEQNCIPLRAGHSVYVYNRHPSGWWDGASDGLRGWFPSNHV